LASAAAISIPLAGCSGSTSDNSTAPNASTEESSGGDGDGDDSAPQTDDTEDAGPTLDEFAYPNGADRDGVDGAALFSTHESTLVEAGSLTYEGDRTDVFNGDEFQQTQTNKFDANDISRELTEGEETEQHWSPAGEDVAYVRMESGFDQAYRVDNRAPPTGEVTGLGEFRQYLSEVEWGEATEVVETADGFGVVYESIGYSDRLGFGEMEEFDAAVTVTESGYVSELEYAQTMNQGGDTVEFDVASAVTSVGETTVEEPDWADTAREDGVRFDVALTDDGTAFRLELTNGNEVSSDARVRLRDDGGSASSSLPRALSVGDVLFVGLSETGDLLTDENGAPEEARALTGNLRLTVDTMFPLLAHTRRL
jgi:hypothetical protein